MPTSNLVQAIDQRLKTNLSPEDRQVYLQIRDRLMEQATEITKLKVACRQVLKTNQEISEGLQFVKANLRKISSHFEPGNS